MNLVARRASKCQVTVTLFRTEQNDFPPRQRVKNKHLVRRGLFVLEFLKSAPNAKMKRLVLSTLGAFFFGFHTAVGSRELVLNFGIEI